MTSTTWPARPAEFIVTREYRRFVEFCDECRRARYIGLCCGLPGVGKTVSARQYAHWDELEVVLGPPPHRHDGIPPPGSGPWQTVLYTPDVINTPRIVERDLAGLWRAVSGLARRAIQQTAVVQPAPVPDLLIVDEADRLKTAALEQLRDVYDRRHIGLVLIGMPGLQKRLARYAQLYSRVGFVHHYQALSGRELQLVVERHWIQLGLESALDRAIGADVLNAVARHGWQLSAGPTLVLPDRMRADYQWPGERHYRGRRRRRRDARDRLDLTLARYVILPERPTTYIVKSHTSGVSVKRRAQVPGDSYHVVTCEPLSFRCTCRRRRI
jgi:AAA domain